MQTEFECIPCAVNSYLRLAETGVVPEAQKEALLRKLLELLSKTDYKLSPPALGRDMHQLIRATLGNEDPYREIKQKYNKMLLELYPEFKAMVEKSDDPFCAALRLAIGGNVIDFGAKYQFDVMETINNARVKQLALDDSEALREALKNARSLLYIGDNCGEIVLDRVFLEQLDVPEKYFAVRGGPIINDITEEDARLVKMEEVAEVVTTGDNSPGAVWETVSEDFRRLFHKADVVISKGQGNLEGLLDVSHPNIYFLLVTKCDLIAEKIGTEKGQYVVRRGITS